ncbi:MAG: hypothetical protein AB1507_00295 [Bacillota bacterium]|jgi:hypothetical protein|nr:hypothetical protein [Thermoanaerobacteraceae bacterium]
MRAKLRWGFLFFPLVAGAVVLAILVTRGGWVSASREELVRPETVVIVERQYLCGEQDLVSEGSAPQVFIGLDAEELRERFLVNSGCEVESRLPAAIRLTYRVQDFCPHHRSFCHLGLKDGFMAVFQGPLGFNHRVLRYERSLREESLTPGLRQKLTQGMDFAAQPETVRAQLRRELEYSSETELNAALENIDELQE